MSGMRVGQKAKGESPLLKDGTLVRFLITFEKVTLMKGQGQQQ
jgi:hypothetical protein